MQSSLSWTLGLLVAVCLASDAPHHTHSNTSNNDNANSGRSTGYINSNNRPKSNPAPTILQRVAAFSQHSSGYQTFRIPSLVTAADGTLVLFAEGRAPTNTNRTPVGNESICWGQLASLYDWQCYDKDIVMRRSTSPVSISFANPNQMAIGA